MDDMDDMGMAGLLVGAGEAEAAPEAGEKIGICNIKLCVRYQRTRAVLRSFFAADQLLQDWSGRWRGVVRCEFEVLYNDGHRIAGDYQFQSKTRPALTRHLRACLALPQDGAAARLLRGANLSAMQFLARYEISDAL